MDFTQEEITALKEIVTRTSAQDAIAAHFALVGQRDDEFEQECLAIAAPYRDELDRLATQIEECRKALKECCEAQAHVAVADADMVTDAMAAKADGVADAQAAYDKAYTARVALIEEMAEKAAKAREEHLLKYAADYADPT